MPDKSHIHRIDESALRSKLLDYKVEVDASRSEAIEKEVANISFKKSIPLPKVNLKRVVPALLVVVLATIILFNLDSIKDLFAPAPEIKTIETKVSTPPVNKPVQHISTPTVTMPPVITPTVTNMPPPVKNKVVIPKPDTSPEMNGKKSDTSKEENAAQKPNPVLAEPPSDSSIKKTEINKQDTAVQKTEQPVRKKKKRRRHNANMDELKESTLQQSGSDDDIVVPQ